MPAGSNPVPLPTPSRTLARGNYSRPTCWLPYSLGHTLERSFFHAEETRHFDNVLDQACTLYVSEIIEFLKPYQECRERMRGDLIHRWGTVE